MTINSIDDLIKMSEQIQLKEKIRLANRSFFRKCSDAIVKYVHILSQPMNILIISFIVIFIILYFVKDNKTTVKYIRNTCIVVFLLSFYIKTKI